jgi:murein DD-endopeptidase MepM/ murein hydrolase activator NlpD
MAGKRFTLICLVHESGQAKLTQTGDLIGNVGKSGHASTAHLHFELRRFKNGQMMAIDPAPLLQLRKTSKH